MATCLQLIVRVTNELNVYVLVT